jgi:hypothetical protein
VKLRGIVIRGGREISILSVYLDGILTNIERKKVSIKKLRLDLKNPRIQYFLDTSLNKDKELSDKYTNNDNWKQIEAYILPQAIDRAQINYIRLEKHLFGQTPWSAWVQFLFRGKTGKYDILGVSQRRGYLWTHKNGKNS